jgi:hypothetical protein
VCGVIVTASCPTVAWAQPSSVAVATDLRLQVRAEIERLSSPVRSTRTAAEQALLAFGIDVLPLLPSPDLLTSPSGRQAVRRIRVRLEHDVAEQSVQPTRVSLAGDFTTAQLAKQIEKQTGNAISLQHLSRARLSESTSVSLRDVSFWEAIQTVEADDLSVAFEKETGLFALRPGAAEMPESVSIIDRAFRIDASALTPRAVGDDDDEGLLLSSQLRVLCEPRLRPLFLKYQTSDFELATSDSKTFIEPFNSGASIEVPLGNGGREATLSLSFPASDAAAVSASLHGKVNLLVAASEQPISFRELGRSKRVSRRRGGVTVTVDDVDFEGPRPKDYYARIQLRVNYDLGANAFESHQTWVFHNRVYLVDPDGKQHGPNGGFTTLYQGDGSVGVEYRFDDLATDPSNWEFVYVAPTLLINVEIPINLRNIPIAKVKSKQE